MFWNESVHVCYSPAMYAHAQPMQAELQMTRFVITRKQLKSKCLFKLIWILNSHRSYQWGAGFSTCFKINYCNTAIETPTKSLLSKNLATTQQMNFHHHTSFQLQFVAMTMCVQCFEFDGRHHATQSFNKQRTNSSSKITAQCCLFALARWHGEGISLFYCHRHVLWFSIAMLLHR